MISDAKYEWFQKWENFGTHKRGDEYDQYKEKFAQELLEILYEKVNILFRQNNLKLNLFKTFVMQSLNLPLSVCFFKLEHVNYYYYLRPKYVVSYVS